MEQTDDLLLDISSLCLNCRHRMGCHHREQSKLPVMQCELHEFDAAPQNGAAKVVPHRRSGQGAGICGTCDHRTYCALRDPERPITHCDQYE